MSLDSIQSQTKILYNSHWLDINTIKTLYKKLFGYEWFECSTLDLMFERITSGIEEGVNNEDKDKLQNLNNNLQDYKNMAEILNKNKPYTLVFNTNSNEYGAGGSHWYSIVLKKTGENKYEAIYFNSSEGEGEMPDYKKQQVMTLLNFVHNLESKEAQAITQIIDGKEVSFLIDDAKDTQVEFQQVKRIVQEDGSLCGVASLMNAFLYNTAVRLKEDAVFKTNSYEVAKLRFYLYLLLSGSIGTADLKRFILSDDKIPVTDSQALEKSMQKLESVEGWKNYADDLIKTKTADIKQIIDAQIEAAKNELNDTKNPEVKQDLKHDIRDMEGAKQSVDIMLNENQNLKPKENKLPEVIKTSFKKISEYNNEITIGAVISVLSSIAIILVISFQILPLLALFIPIMAIGLTVFAKGIYDDSKHNKVSVVSKNHELLNQNQVNKVVQNQEENPEVSQRKKLAEQQAASSSSSLNKS